MPSKIIDTLRNKVEKSRLILFSAKYDREKHNTSHGFNAKT